MDSISEALLHLVWLCQPRVNTKWSVGGGSTASPWGSLVSAFWVMASRQQALQKHHLPIFPLLPCSPAPVAHPILCRRSNASSFRSFPPSPETILLVPESSPTAIKDLVEEDFAAKSSRVGGKPTE